MKKQWQRFKDWTRRTWKRITKWFLGVLAAIGVVTVGISAPVTINYMAATEYEDGTPLPLADIAETRVYCNGEMVASEPGADGEFTGLEDVLPVGTHTCYGTHVATNALESGPSNSIQVIVRPGVPPMAPVLDE